jgi:hypothetical protein
VTSRFYLQNEWLFKVLLNKGLDKKHYYISMDRRFNFFNLSDDGRTLIIDSSDQKSGCVVINEGSFEHGMKKGDYLITALTWVIVSIFA